MDVVPHSAVQPEGEPGRAQPRQPARPGTEHGPAAPAQPAAPHEATRPAQPTQPARLGPEPGPAAPAPVADIHVRQPVLQPAGVQPHERVQDEEIVQLRRRLAELEGNQPAAQDLPELTPYPLTRHLVRGSLERTFDHMLRHRRLRQMYRPNILERLGVFKIPLLAGLLAPAGRTALPLGAANPIDLYGKIKTAGDLSRATGAFAASTVSPAVLSGSIAALARGTVDVGKWIMRKYNAVHVLADEIRRRTGNNFNKGRLEFNHLFKDDGDIAQLTELRQELDAGVPATQLGLHPDEMRRLVKKSLETRLEKLSLERILPANSRAMLDEQERLRFDNIEFAFDAARRIYDGGLDRQQKASLLWELRQSLPIKDRIKHTTLIMKRMGVFALGGAAVGAVTSMVKSLSETGLLADCGNRVGKGIKKGTEYLGKAAANLYHSVTSSVGGWLDKINLQNLNFNWPATGASASPATSGTFGLSQATATAKAADLGSAFFPASKTAWDIGHIINPQTGQNFTLIFPKTIAVPPTP